MSLNEIVCFCDEPSEFEFRDGVVYVRSSGGICHAYRPHTFYASFHNAAECMQECNRATCAEVIEFPGRAVG